MTFEFKTVMYNGALVPVPISPYPFQRCQPHSKELRFIRVLPAETYDEVIKCEIFHQTLDQVEYFAALSYEWGDPSCCGIVIIDGLQVPATIKLIEALWCLRQHDCPVLWIDSLCINQEDYDERNAHLKLMKDIYHEADIVCAYIGSAADGSKQVMDILRHIDESRSLKRPQQAVKEPWTPNELQLSSMIPQLQAFFNRSYWHRVWIIQEIALSSRLRVFCDSSSVRWAAVDLLIQFLSTLPQFNDMDWTIRYLSDMRLKQLQKTPIGLLQLLQSSRSAKATDQRDRVYALLGLCFDGSDFVPEPHYDWSESMICLDITKTMVFKRRSLDIMLARTDVTTRSLPSWCPDYFSCSSEPIWARMAAYITGFDEKFRMGRKSARWVATDNSIVTRRDLNFTQNGLLKIQGFHLGIINSIGCTLSDHPNIVPQVATSPTHASTVPLPGLHSSENKEKECFRKLARVLGVYLRPAASQIKKPVDSASGNYGAMRLYYHLYEFEKFDHLTRSKRYEADFDKIQRWRKRNKNFMVEGTRFKERSNNWRAAREAGRMGDAIGYGVAKVVEAGIHGAVQSYLGSAATASTSQIHDKLPADLEGALLSLSDLIDEGLRLITTNSGLVGWAHPSAQLGDHLYLLQGCSMPVILRPAQPKPAAVGVDQTETEQGTASNCNDGHYTMIGHGIIDQAMDGSLWSNLLRSVPTKGITLQ